MSSKMQRTRERAYQIWEEEGRPEGREIDHWLQAEGELHEGVDAEDTQPGGEIHWHKTTPPKQLPRMP